MTDKKKFLAQIVGFEDKIKSYIEDAIDVISTNHDSSTTQEYGYDTIKQEMTNLVLKIFNEEEWIKLQHHFDSTSGLYCIDFDPKTLLHEFWNQNSDSCPLEASEMEDQENKWSVFVDKFFFQL